jgi:hypothetical protein
MSDTDAKSSLFGAARWGGGAGRRPVTEGPDAPAAAAPPRPTTTLRAVPLPIALRATGRIWS